MIQTGDFKFIRTLNGQLVLNMIRKHEVISSTELTTITGLRPSTIFNILKELSDKTLILNLGKGDSTEKGGKKPYLWELNKDAAYVIGLDIEINNITAVILDLKGNLLHHSTLKFEKLQSEEELINVINSIVQNILEKSKIEQEKFLGLGIAMPAIVDSEMGVVKRTDVISDKNIPLTNKLNEYYKFPIVVENNANSTAVGAKWVGAGKDFKNFLVVLAEFDQKVGGMGVGILIDEHLYNGHTNCAGELNIPILNLGQMLIYIRNQISQSEYLREYDLKIEELTVDILIEAAKAGDELAISLFKRLGTQIGEIISNSISLLNPEALIVAGNISDLDDIIIDPIREVINLKSLPFITQKLKVIPSLHGPNSVATGAASLILNEFFKIPIVKRKGISENISIFSE
ncbi:MAG: ROK family protein [Rhodothermaceae bacterium]